MAVSGVGTVGGELGWATSRAESSAREEGRIAMPTSNGQNELVSERMSMRAVEESTSTGESMSADNAGHLAEAVAQRVLQTGQGAVQAAAAAIDVTGLDTGT